MFSNSTFSDVVVELSSPLELYPQHNTSHLSRVLLQKMEQGISMQSGLSLFHLSSYLVYEFSFFFESLQGSRHGLLCVCLLDLFLYKQVSVHQRSFVLPHSFNFFQQKTRPPSWDLESQTSRLLQPEHHILPPAMSLDTPDLNAHAT